MSRRSDDNKDVLSKIHEQIVKDQNNDSTQIGRASCRERVFGYV